MAKRKIKKKAKNLPKSKKFTSVEDKFWDEDSGVNAEDARVVKPTRRDILEEISQLDSFHGIYRELRGNSLTYGDY